MPETRSQIRQVIDRIAAQCERFQVVGDYRLGERNVQRLEFVIVPKTGKGKDQEDFFAEKTVDQVQVEVAAMVRDGQLDRKGDSVLFGGTIIQLVLRRCKPYAFASMCVKFTGGKDLMIAVGVTAKARGWAWIPEVGLRRKGGSGDFIKTDTEEEFFKALGIPWVEPQLRKVGIIFPNSKPSTDEPLTKDDLRKWVRGSKWNFSKCAGQAHEYTLRFMAESDDMVLRVIKMIHDYGYAGWYLGKDYRYLDLDGHFYFTQGYRWDETQLINRKRLVDHEARPEHEWKRNPTKMHLLTIR